MLIGVIAKSSKHIKFNLSLFLLDNIYNINKTSLIEKKIVSERNQTPQTLRAYVCKSKLLISADVLYENVR